MELIAQLEHVSAASLTAVLIVAAAGLLMGLHGCQVIHFLLDRGELLLRAGSSGQAFASRF